MTDFDEIEKNLLGTVNPNMIAFSGVGPGISPQREMGVVRNTTSFGEYYDVNFNLIVRENCSTAVESRECILFMLFLATFHLCDYFKTIF